MACLKVAIVGHSQIPVSFPDIPSVDLRVFRLPGGRLGDFERDCILKDSLKWAHDLTILFIGGNDIPNLANELIVGKLIELVDKFKALGSCNVVVTLIEPREYSYGNRFGIDNDVYKYSMNFINRKIKRLSKSRNYRVLNVNAKPFQNGHTADGVHFNLQSRFAIVDKIRNCVVKHLN